MKIYVASCSISRLLENPSSTVDDSSQRMKYSDFYVVGTCKGLVCSARSVSPTWNSLYLPKFEEFWVRFFNPTTRIMSEDSPRMCLRSSDYIIGRFGVKFGFGYDDSSDTFKVVATFINIKSQKREFRVYNLGDTRWRKTLTCAAIPFTACSAQFVCGTVNWVSLRNTSSSYFDNQWDDVTDIDQLAIFSYDLKNETYRYLLKPAGLVEVPSFVAPDLKVLNGCLCMFYNHKGSHFVVWMMREFGNENSWTQFLKVSKKDLQIHQLTWVDPVCVSENEDVVLLNHGSFGFIVYNKRDNRVDSRGYLGNREMVLSYDYAQSLALPY